MLIILGEKLDSFAKARTMKQAKTMMMNAIQKELDGRLHDSECRNCHLAIAHTDNEEAALEFKKEVEERFPNADVYMAPLSLSIACHIGPGSLALTATRKMENLPEAYAERQGSPDHPDGDVLYDPASRGEPDPCQFLKTESGGAPDH